MLECTNAGVERDAGLKRNLDDVTKSGCKSDTVDSRMRVFAEGPVIEASKTEARICPLLLEAGADFLMRRARRAGTTGSRKRSAPLSSKHKSNISAASKRPKVAHNADEAEVDLPDGDAPEGTAIAAAEDQEATVGTLFGDLEEQFAEDATGGASGFKSVQKPVPKKLLSKQKGNVMSCIPGSAEEEEAGDAGGDEEGEEEPLAPSSDED